MAISDTDNRQFEHLRPVPRIELPRTTLEHLTDGIVTTDADGNVAYLNAAAATLCGWSVEEATGQSLDAVFELSGEQAAGLHAGAPVPRLGATDGKWRRGVLVARDGMSHSIDYHMRSIETGADNDTAGVLVLRRIVPDQGSAPAGSQQGQENGDSEGRYRAVVESQSEMLSRFRRDGTILYANPAYARMLNTSPEALTNANLWHFIPREERSRIRETLDRLTPEDCEVRIENRFRTAEGNRWILWTNRALTFDERGDWLEAQSTGIDITERRNTEKALRESEERFRELANNIDQFAWTCEKLGYVTWYNHRWYEYTGTTFESMQGDGWIAVHHPDHIARVVSGLKDAAARQETWEETFPLRGKDGKYRWFLSRAVPILNESGDIIRWFGTNTDITEQRELEFALRHADRRKDEFLATLSHELRNPLAPIQNFLEILREKNADPELYENAREAISRQVSHLVRLVDDLLDVSRITRDRLELRKSRVDLGSVILHAIETCRPLAEAEEQTIELDMPDEPVVLDADPVRLSQVFNNLLNNACKYSPRGECIRIAAIRKEPRVELSIIDNGIGMPPDKLDGIFEMFAQVQHSSEQMTGGLGIGLTLVKRLIKLHGGTITARSDGPGQGSEFIVSLPILQDSNRAVSRDESDDDNPQAAPSVRVLVVDDNRDNADSLAMLLNLNGHETRVAYDGPTSLQAAEAFRPDAILLDLGLPGLDGIEVCRRLRKQPWGRDTVIVAVTGWGQDDDRRKSAEAGFDEHLVKPLEYGRLQQLLASVSSS